MRAPGKEQAAWDAFFERYTPALRSYCAGIGLHAAEVDDAVQDALILLARLIGDFHYDPAPERRFRNYLITLAHRCALKQLRRAARKRNVALTEDHHGSRAPIHLGAADSRRWLRALGESALCLLATEVRATPRTIEIFRASVLEARPIPEVAEEHQVSADEVYRVRSRYFSRFKDCYLRLAQNSGADFEAAADYVREL
ncbi:RNA polymerase sigma factor [Actomonas aquatica]|uniref:Sigma-70 family RNA polymerase sigma factor n=1 Tax=Actomonas aquatica TaxID=2866162 RepID=A0ABZ1C602_9BACT|nr:sigma-70 family RNA polymerase sigma factor [Opitutus sp. WL0086]WRQ85725.1 sigma-70 family RNA polymerase sigma factor [Opitutus sp. WL0086]